LFKTRGRKWNQSLGSRHLLVITCDATDEMGLKELRFIKCGEPQRR